MVLLIKNDFCFSLLVFFLQITRFFPPMNYFTHEQCRYGERRQWCVNRLLKIVVIIVE